MNKKNLNESHSNFSNMFMGKNHYHQIFLVEMWPTDASSTTVF
jgi:hypothetical protein